MEDFFRLGQQMLKLPINKLGNPLDQISDLVEVLDKTLKDDYMIAGGFVRDWYCQTEFNDIDIYLFPGNLNSPEADKYVENVRQQLTSLRNFRILNTSNKYFLDTQFCETTWYSKKQKYNVQFIMWNESPKQVLEEYDLEHCRFFIPVKNLSENTKLPISADRIPLVDNQKALTSITENRLILTDYTKNFLSSVSRGKHYSPKSVHRLECIVKRCGKFYHNRKMSLPKEYNITQAIESYIANISNDPMISRIYKADSPYFSTSPIQSAILEGADDYDFNARSESKYTIREILENLVYCWGSLLPEEELTQLLVSPSQIVRESAKKYVTGKDVF